MSDERFFGYVVEVMADDFSNGMFLVTARIYYTDVQ